MSRVTENSFADVESIFDDLRAYSRCVDGVDRRDGAATEFVTALPPGSHVRNKHSFVMYRHGSPVGLLDIIAHYPAPNVAFIGLLAVRESLHGIGLGRALYDRAEHLIRTDLRATTVRIAVIETNPACGFWRRMGFRTTGEVKRYEGRAVTSHAILMEKPLASASE
ncbi:GNAT family N-acetyltransferase [Methylobacterium gossipiicola]|nr:GNAT family N-acetyltransferase [Methylobacterium gossipiicola]